jgi:AcrR family transcriptional regulator
MQDMSRKSHKRELFRVAFKMFILKSFDGVSIPDIEKATGFTRGTIFHYADTKLDLFRQVVEYYVLERQDIERKIQVADDCTLRQFIDTYAKGVERTMEALHEIVGMDVPMRDCSRAYLNMMSQMSVLLPEIHKTFLNAMAKEEKLWMEVIGRGVENGELQNDVQPTILAKIMMSLFYGRAFQDSLIDGMDPKLLKEEMLAVYERVKKR